MGMFGKIRKVTQNLKIKVDWSRFDQFFNHISTIGRISNFYLVNYCRHSRDVYVPVISSLNSGSFRNVGLLSDFLKSALTPRSISKSPIGWVKFYILGNVRGAPGSWSNGLGDYYEGFSILKVFKVETIFHNFFFRHFLFLK